MDPRIEAIAKLYLIFAHATDGTLTGDEMRLLAEKLRSWQPDAALDAVGEQIKTTVDAYKKLGDRDTRLAEAKRCAGVLAKTLTPEQCDQILGDLGDLAAADGKIVPEETSLLDELADILVVKA
jgi:uncharacterized tellurite resistance protein B-like protein